MLEVFYRKVGGDYSNVLYRLENDETILLFLEKFLREDSYQNFLIYHWYLDHSRPIQSEESILSTTLLSIYATALKTVGPGYNISPKRKVGNKYYRVLPYARYKYIRFRAKEKW